MKVTKTLIVKKPEFQENYSNKVLIFKIKLEDGKLISTKGILECDFTDGTRGQIKLDWEIEMYRGKFSKHFEELMTSSKKSMTVKCVFN